MSPPETPPLELPRVRLHSSPPKKRRRLATLLLLFLATAAHAQNGRVLLPDHLRPVAQPGMGSLSTPAELVRSELTDAESSESLNIELILKFRHYAELKRRVAAGETVPAAEIESRYLPRKEDHETVSEWLRGQGLKVDVVGVSHAIVLTRGRPDQLRDIFKTKFSRVRFKGEEFTAAVETPSLPAGIANVVGSIHGLQPYLHPRKTPRRAAAAAAASSTVAPPYLVRDILKAYHADGARLTGTGQQIGIIIDTLPSDRDLTQFWTANDIPQTLGHIIGINLARGGVLSAASGEETLDVCWSSSIAPAARVVMYACGDLMNVNAAYSRILDELQRGDRPELHQISMSYGADEVTGETVANLRSTNQIFTAITAYGVSLFASSGDEGAFGVGGSARHVNFPASDPNVTGVGGTSLRLDGRTGTVVSETAWSPTGLDGSSGDDSSGGGESSYFPRPSWQAAIAAAPGAMRLTPDVALTADPALGAYLVLHGKVEQYGGTSWAAPCWAGFCALINEGRASQGHPSLALVNSLIYPLLGSPSFRDITAGNNGAYSAGPGYDLVTGLGVPDFAELLQPLANITVLPPAPAPAITSDRAASGIVGRSFAYQIVATSLPTAFMASGLPGGLSTDPSTGLISGTPAESGTFAVTLGATNAAGTGDGSLSLTFAPALPTVTLTRTTPRAILIRREFGAVTLNISEPLPEDLLINYEVNGRAVNGWDYKFLRGEAKLKAGRTAKVVKVKPLGDLGGEGRKDVVITLAEGDGYIVGEAVSAKVKVINETAVGSLPAPVSLIIAGAP